MERFESIRVQATTADGERFLVALTQAGIAVNRVEMDTQLDMSFSVKKSDYTKLAQIGSNRGVAVKIIASEGGRKYLSILRKRPVLTVTIALLLALTVIIPMRILFITVEGNMTVPTHRIITAATKCGIRFGAVRRQIRSEKCKNIILGEVPQLQWVGVNTYGCVARIRVKEKTQPEEASVSTALGLCAVTDGIIRDMTVTSGSPLCEVGEAVKTGQLLVSPYKDCGSILRTERVDAEIYADTVQDLRVVTPLIYDARTGAGRENKKISVRFGKKVINLFKDSGILDTGCVKIYREHSLALGEGLRLPLTLIEHITIEYERPHKERLPEKVFSWLPAAAEDMLRSDMAAGEILRCRATSTTDNDLLFYNAQYDCYQMIAQPYNKEIVINHAERN